MSLTQMITPGACGKFQGSSIDFPFTTSILNKSPKRAFFCLDRPFLTSSLSTLHIDSGLGNNFFFSLEG